MSGRRGVFLKTWWSGYLGEVRPFHDNYIYWYNQECVFSGDCVFILTPSQTPTMTATPTITPTVTPTNTLTPTSTPSNTPSETPAVTPTNTQTQTPSVSPTQTNTPSLTASPTQTTTPSETPAETPTNTPSVTPTLTPTNTTTQTVTPSITASPTVTPSVTTTRTPTVTPSSTPVALCAEQLNILYPPTGFDYPNYSAFTGTYNRLYSFTGGTFTGGYIFQSGSTDYFVSGPAPDGNVYAVFGYISGSTYYQLAQNYNAGNPPGFQYNWFIKKTSGDYFSNGGSPLTPVSLVVGNNNITSGGIYYPQQGTDTGFYAQVSYPVVCPTTTPTATQTATPSVTPTNTQTPSVTPTITPSPTCGTFTQQYMTAELQSCHNFKLSLWSDTSGTIAANAVCDVVVSGCAYGDQGTIFCGTETILSGQHNHNFSLQPVLQPGECVSAFTVNTITEQCPCYEVTQIQVTPTPTPSVTQTATPSVSPTNTETPTNTPSNTATQTPSVTPTTTTLPCICYETTITSGGKIVYVDCAGNTVETAPLFDYFTFNAISGSPYPLGAVAFQECGTPTPTPSVTQTATPSVTPTNTETPTNTPSETPTNTPTNTTTQTMTPSITPSATMNEICPQEIEITGLSGNTDITGTYQRTFTYTGGSFNYGYISISPSFQFLPDTLYLGNQYVVYTRQSGTNFYTVVFVVSFANQVWIIYKSTGDYIFNGGTFVSGWQQNNSETIGGLYYPQRGFTLNNLAYISYPAICPSPTPSQTPSVTPTNTQTNTPTPSITASVTPSITPSNSATPSVTPSITPSVTPTRTPTRTPTNTPTPSITPNCSNCVDSIFYTATTSGILTAYLCNPIPGVNNPKTFGISAGIGQLTGYGCSSGINSGIDINGLSFNQPGFTYTVGTNCCTPTPSVTPSITPSNTATPSVTPTNTPSITPSNSPTPSITASVTPSVTATQTATPSVTPSSTASSLLPYSLNINYNYDDGCQNQGCIFGYDTALDACNSTGITLTIYSTASTITDGVELYFDNTGLSAFWTNDSTYLKWNGISFRSTGGTAQDVASCASPTPSPTNTATVTPTPSQTPAAVYSFANCGVSDTSAAGACSDAGSNPKTLYSTCSSLSAGCVLFFDSGLTNPVIQLYTFADGSNWDMDGGGQITGPSTVQC